MVNKVVYIPARVLGRAVVGWWWCRCFGRCRSSQALAAAETLTASWRRPLRANSVRHRTDHVPCPQHALDRPPRLQPAYAHVGPLSVTSSQGWSNGGGQFPTQNFWLSENCRKIFLSENAKLALKTGKHATLFKSENLCLTGIKEKKISDKITTLSTHNLFWRKFEIVCSQNSVGKFATSCRPIFSPQRRWTLS